MSCFTLVAPRRSEDASALTLDLRTQPYSRWIIAEEKRHEGRKGLFGEESFDRRR